MSCCFWVCGAVNRRKEKVAVDKEIAPSSKVDKKVKLAFARQVPEGVLPSSVPFSPKGVKVVRSPMRQASPIRMDINEGGVELIARRPLQIRTDISEEEVDACVEASRLEPYRNAQVISPEGDGGRWVIQTRRHSYIVDNK